jgi:hypothetical protein
MTRLIIGFWVVLSVGLGVVEAQEAREAQWMAVLVNGKKVGYYKKTRVANADSVVTTELITYEIDAGTEKVEMLSMNETVETASGRLIRFRKESVQKDVNRRVLGQVLGDTLHVAGVANGQKSLKMLDWFDDVQMVEGRRLHAQKYALKPGTRYYIRQFLVDFMAIAEVSVEIHEAVDVQLIDRVATLTETREVLQVLGRTLNTVAYVNDQMRPMKVVIPQVSMEMIDCTEAYALTPPE